LQTVPYSPSNLPEGLKKPILGGASDNVLEKGPGRGVFENAVGVFGSWCFGVTFLAQFLRNALQSSIFFLCFHCFR
jgi:hypothetical protein